MFQGGDGEAKGRIPGRPWNEEILLKGRLGLVLKSPQTFSLLQCPSSSLCPRNMGISSPVKKPWPRERQ